MRLIRFLEQLAASRSFFSDEWQPLRKGSARVAGVGGGVASPRPSPKGKGDCFNGYKVLPLGKDLG